jgi:hypothetical protein
MTRSILSPIRLCWRPSRPNRHRLGLSGDRVRLGFLTHAQRRRSSDRKTRTATGRNQRVTRGLNVPVLIKRRLGTHWQTISESILWLPERNEEDTGWTCMNQHGHGLSGKHKCKVEPLEIVSHGKDKLDKVFVRQETSSDTDKWVREYVSKKTWYYRYHNTTQFKASDRIKYCMLLATTCICSGSKIRSWSTACTCERRPGSNVRSRYLMYLEIKH